MTKKLCNGIVFIYEAFALLSAISLLLFYNFVLYHGGWLWLFFNWFQSPAGLTITALLSAPVCIVKLIGVVKILRGKKTAPLSGNVVFFLIAALNTYIYTLGWMIYNFYDYFA